MNLTMLRLIDQSEHCKIQSELLIMIFHLSKVIMLRKDCYDYIRQAPFIQGSCCLFISIIITWLKLQSFYYWDMALLQSEGI